MHNQNTCDVWFTTEVQTLDYIHTWLLAAAPMDRLRGPNETHALQEKTTTIK